MGGKKRWGIGGIWGGGWLNEEGRGNQGVRKDNKRRVFLFRLLNGRKLEVPNGKVSGSQTSNMRKWKVYEITEGEKGREVVKNQEVTGEITARRKTPTVIRSVDLRHSGLSPDQTGKKQFRSG